MGDQIVRHPMTSKRVVYEIPGMEAVPTRREVEYQRDHDGGLGMDLYYPTNARAVGPLPALVFVHGFSDVGFRSRMGCRFKEMASSVSWAQLMAMSGIIAISYANRDPEHDLHGLWQYVQQNAASLGIDGGRVGVFASSGHVPLALSLLVRGAGRTPKCAVLCYGYTLDLDGAGDVADAAEKWGFVNPCAGRRCEDLARDVPILIVRAGADEMPHLNDALDRFVGWSLRCNMPLTVLNRPASPHAFDLLQANDTSRETVKDILAFARAALAAG